MGRLLILSEFYCPTEGRTIGILEDLVEDLANRGHDITVVCGDARYGGGSMKRGEGMVPERVKVMRYQMPVASRRSVGGRLFHWLWLLLRMRRAILLHGAECDAVLAVVNPIPIHWVMGGHRVGANTPRRVALVWDLLPDSAVALELLRPHSLSVSLARGLNRKTLEGLDRVVVPGQDMKRHLVETYALRDTQVEVISNWSDASRLYLDSSLILPRERQPQQPFMVLLAGGLGRAQDVNQLKRLAVMIEGESEMRLQVVGTGPLIIPLWEWVREQGLAHMTVLDFCEGPEFGHLLSTASVGLVLLSPRLLGLGVPSRTYTYLCAGLPVLALVPPSCEIALQLAQNAAGIVATDAEQALESLRMLQNDPRLYRNMSTAALHAAQGPLSRDTSVKQYEQVLFGRGEPFAGFPSRRS
jgi:glycosyltransferase involved in cell wall biosynthesis